MIITAIKIICIILAIVLIVLVIALGIALGNGVGNVVGNAQSFISCSETWPRQRRRRGRRPQEMMG